MKNNTDNHLDKLSKKVMQESLLEAPSLELPILFVGAKVHFCGCNYVSYAYH